MVNTTYFNNCMMSNGIPKDIRDMCVSAVKNGADQEDLRTMLEIYGADDRTINIVIFCYNASIR